MGRGSRLAAPSQSSGLLRGALGWFAPRAVDVRRRNRLAGVLRYGAEVVAVPLDSLFSQAHLAAVYGRLGDKHAQRLGTCGHRIHSLHRLPRLRAKVCVRLAQHACGEVVLSALLWPRVDRHWLVTALLLAFVADLPAVQNP